MTEPRRPRPIVSNASETWKKLAATADVSLFDSRLALMDDGLVESRAPASRLIDHVARHSLTHEIRIPALPSIRRRFETRAGVGRTVHHDHRPTRPVLVGWNLELHVHLADGDLVRTGRWRRR